MRPSSSSPAPASSSFLAPSACLPRRAAVEWVWAWQGAQLSARLPPAIVLACWWCKRNSCFSTALQMGPFAAWRLASRLEAPLAASTGSTSASRSTLHASHQARPPAPPCHQCVHGGFAPAPPAPRLTAPHRASPCVRCSRRRHLGYCGCARWPRRLAAPPPSIGELPLGATRPAGIARDPRPLRRLRRLAAGLGALTAP